MTKQPQLVLAERGTEAGRWYTKSGKLVESVSSFDGKKQVKPTMVHARKLDLVPGHTTIVNLPHKEMLVRWKQEQAIMAALTLPRMPDEAEKAWYDRVLEDAEATATAAREEGTRIHANLKAHFAGEEVNPDYQENVDGITRCLDQALGIQDWRSEQTFVHPLGYAATLDLFSDEWCIDLKGADGDEQALLKRATYLEHELQLGAQGACIEENWCEQPPQRRFGILFTSRTHRGQCAIKEILPPDVARGWRCFVHLLNFWKEKNDL